MNKQVWLAWRVGVEDTQPIPLKEGSNIVGRSLESHVIGCKSEVVSRRHCEIIIRDGFAFVKDLKALNGTFIGDTRLDIERLVEIKHGDIISLGKPYLSEEQVRSDSSHFAYKIHSVQESSQPAASVKRRSSLGECNDLKRHKGSTSPTRIAQASSTSTPVKPEVIDLTDDDEKKFAINSVIDTRRESHRREKKNNLCPPYVNLNQVDNIPKTDLSDFNISDVTPLAHSTFRQGDLAMELLAVLYKWDMLRNRDSGSMSKLSKLSSDMNSSCLPSKESFTSLLNEVPAISERIQLQNLMNSLDYGTVSNNGTDQKGDLLAVKRKFEEVGRLLDSVMNGGVSSQVSKEIVPSSASGEEKITCTSPLEKENKSLASESEPSIITNAIVSPVETSQTKLNELKGTTELPREDNCSLLSQKDVRHQRNDCNVKKHHSVEGPLKINSDIINLPHTISESSSVHNNKDSEKVNNNVINSSLQNDFLGFDSSNSSISCSNNEISNNLCNNQENSKSILQNKSITSTNSNVDSFPQQHGLKDEISKSPEVSKQKISKQDSPERMVHKNNRPISPVQCEKELPGDLVKLLKVLETSSPNINDSVPVVDSSETLQKKSTSELNDANRQCGVPIKNSISEVKNQSSFSSDSEYNVIEENLRNIVGETSSVSIVNNNCLKTGQSHEEDDGDMQLGNDSFSQKDSALTEVDEDDIRYSQLFADEIQQEPDDVIIVDDDDNFLDCSVIIKEEADDFHEEEDDSLFKCHFSQYSQDEDINSKDTKKNKTIKMPLSLEKEKKSKDIESDTKIQIAAPPLTVSTETKLKENIVSLEPVASTSGKQIYPKERSISMTSKKPSISENVPSAPFNATIPLEVLSLPDLKELTGAKLVKSTLLTTPLKVQRKKTKKQLQKAEPSATRDAHKKKQYERLKNERRQKLKELTLQKKGSGDDTTINRADSINKEKQVNEHDLKADVSKDSKIAKITERNRSSILLEGFLDEPQRKKRGRPKKSISKETSMDSLSTTQNKVIQCKDVQVKLKSCLRPVFSKSITKKSVTFNLKPEIKHFECEGVLNKLVTGNLLKIKDQPPQIANIKSPYLNVNGSELFYKIVHWNALWINECTVIKGDPPLSHPDTVVKNKDMFVSYADYTRWLNPLLLHEIWANIIKTKFDTDTNKSARMFDCFVIATETSRNDQRLLTLKCSLPIKRKQIPTLIDPMDHLLIKVVKETNNEGNNPGVQDGGNDPGVQDSGNNPGAQDSGNKILVLFGVVSSQVKVIGIRDVKDPVARTCLARQQANSQNKSTAEVCAFFDVMVYNSPQRKIVESLAIKIRPTYNMRTEVKQFEGLLALRCSPLLEIILDPEKNNKIILPPGLDEKIVTALQLNEEQQKAVLSISKTVSSEKPSISLIHGPPGSGKTRLIVALVEQLLHKFKEMRSGKKQMMMICAQSNSAIDEICIRLLDRRRHLTGNDRFRLTRYGKREKISIKLNDILTTTIAQKEVEKLNLDEVFSTELSVMKARETMIAASLENCTRDHLNEYRRNYSFVQNRRSILEQIVNKTAKEEVRKREIDRLVSDEELRVLHHCDIIATTLGSCVTSRIRQALSEGFGNYREIGVCIIDEATQATELDTLLPLLYNIKKFVLIGDPQQLFPVVLSETSKNNGLQQSLFSRLHKVWSNVDANKNVITPVHVLKTQYRMHPEIVKFPSLEFYNNSLVTPPYLSVHRYFKPYAVFTHDFKQDPDSAESNTEEAEFLIDFVDKLLLQPVFDRLSIGLIVPYQKQRGIIAGYIHDKKWKRIVTVNTIDSYQGQEKDIIILATVRTNGVGFLTDYQRTNVAITRAKRACYIVANFSSLQAEPLWKRLLVDAQKRRLHLALRSPKCSSNIIRFIVDEKKRIYC